MRMSARGILEPGLVACILEAKACLLLLLSLGPLRVVDLADHNNWPGVGSPLHRSCAGKAPAGLQVC